MDITEAYKKLFDKQTVVDVAPAVVYIGRLVEANDFFITLAEADVHDLSGSVSKEVYLMEAKRNGLQPNRKLVKIKQQEVLSLSLLDDIVLY